MRYVVSVKHAAFTALLCVVMSFVDSSWARNSQPTQPQEVVRDLAQIRSTGLLRVLINESRNSSGDVKEQAIGTEYMRVRAFVHALNQDAQAGRSIRLQLIPKPKDQLLDALRRGEGDLVAPGELISTHATRGIVASIPVQHAVPLVVIARKGNRVYQTLDDLSARQFMLPRGSAAVSGIEALNEKLKSRSRAPVTHQIADSSLAAEDLLELVNSGLYLLTAVEQPIAERWAKVLPNIRIDRHMVLLSDHQRWYVRRGANNLLARVDRFAKNYRAPADRDTNFQRIYRRMYRLHNIRDDVVVRRLKMVRPVLERVARQQNLDGTLLAAIAYKESTLNPKARGGAGAVGLMQVTPIAAKAAGVSNYTSLEGNVLASAKYLSLIRKQHFSSAQITEQDRQGFMLAAYNMGPGRVDALRAEAKRQGLDANRWFFQVERIAMEQMGLQVAHYVSAVNKYQLIYKRDFAR